nr:hypothetical protein [uncultured Prevotella sp.]
MTNDKSNKELDKSTLRIPTFNMILRQILVVNAYGDKSLSGEILLQDELFYNTVSQLNFSKDSSEVRQLLSYLLELTGEPDSYLVEEILLDFVIGKGCKECSKTVCENIFGKQPTFADMMRHPWFEHLMNHPAQTEPYNPLSPFVRNDAFYWRNFHSPLFYHLQEGNSLALEVLEHLAAKGDILSMERVSLYYFDKCQFSKAFLLFKALHEKMQTTEWYDWAMKQEITYKLAHLYTYGEGVELNLDKAAQYYKELDSGYNWGNRAQYLLGRMAEKRHNYQEAMDYYLKNIDCSEYSKYSFYRGDKPKDLFPLRLEIAFRQMKKKLNPIVDCLTLATCQKCNDMVLLLKVMINAIVTIEWGDGETESVKWKVDDWGQVRHSYQSPGYYCITIKTDEENVLTGFHIVSHKAICSINVSGCKGLTHLLCPNQMLKQLLLNRQEYLSVLDVHGNRLQRINLRKNPLLTIVDCSNNPLQKIEAVKHPPFSLMCIRKTRLGTKAKRRFHEIVRLNAGRILSEGFVNQLTEPLLPTLLFYIKNSTWEDVLACLQQKDEDSKVNNNSTVLHRVYALLKAYRHVTPCPYKNGFMWVRGTWVFIAHKFKTKRTGQIVESQALEQEFYLYERPWSMILGTPVKAWDNRLPFMMLPQHPNAYYAAMCLYNMVNNEKEMKKHKIPKIVYGKETF